jgi:uncharacterized protein YdeI (YjbR/CyaY-like superfamily)
MGTKDPRVDAYIAKSAAFAQPILTELRELVHQACPAVEETMKWSFPHFMHHGMLCGMAAFKQHISFGFWRDKQVVAPDHDKGEAAMGQFGRITRRADMPAKKVIIAYIKKAAALNEQGVKTPRAVKREPRAVLVAPDDFLAAIQRNKKALKTYEAFSPSQKRDYIEWIIEAKREETRTRRIETAVEWMAEGKSRNWKYENC